MKKLILSGFLLIFLAISFMTNTPPPPSGWYQQFMPNLGSKQIKDIAFLDSLNGITVANIYPSDSNYVLRTTNGGDNWQIINRQYYPMQHIQFLNLTTGFSCAGYLYKTTDGGFTWNNLNTSGISAGNMFVLNQDTIWLVDSDGLVGGVFRTTNGGGSWQQQFSGGSQNPNKIYMYNARIGYICNNQAASPNIYKTINGGLNWTINLPGEYFYDMFFNDSLVGIKCMPGYIAGDSCVKKTINGGLNWFKQTLPHGGIITAPVIGKFSHINSDTIWGVGSMAFYGGGQFRGIIFRTTNGGNNWLFQVPDTAIHIGSYSFVKFVDAKKGWAYSVQSIGQGGIHTTNGGDTNWLTGINKLSNEVLSNFRLFQNFPNPFNPKTVIPYNLKKSAYVKLYAYDILGKQVQKLVDQKQEAGEYEVDFMGKFASSGVYFYRIEVTDEKSKQLFTETKTMVLVK